MNVRFFCPGCEQPARLGVVDSVQWQCPRCDHLLALRRVDGALSACTVCANHEFYKKKDFPHWLGLTILGAACIAFIVANGLYLQWLAWMILIGSAVFDGLLYLWVADVLVCYRCEAHYRGLPDHSDYKPFDLGIAERYRQERLRREQLQADKNISQRSAIGDQQPPTSR